MTIHVALVSAYPTEADARTALTTPSTGPALADGTPWLGVWASPYGDDRHVFSDQDDLAGALERGGWTRVEDPACEPVRIDADTIASVLAIVDAPHRPGFQGVEMEDEAP